MDDKYKLNWKEGDPLPSLSQQDMLDIASNLDDHHSLFYAMFSLGRIVFTTNIERAAIRFSRRREDNGRPMCFVFNPKFWDECSPYMRNFVICHEMLHVIFKHGFRSVDDERPTATNIAMDIVVNHALIDRFSFDRNKIDDWQKYCWVETTFKGMNVPSTEGYEFYFNILKEQCEEILSKISQLIDEHGFGDMDANGGNGDKVISDLSGMLTEEEKQQLRDMVEKHTQGKSPKEDEKDEKDEHSRGMEDTCHMWNFSNVRSNPKLKWKEVFKEICHRMRHVWAEDETWARTRRRSALLPHDLHLPSEMEDIDATDVNKIKVVVYMDASGSCTHLIERFFACVDSIPRTHFIVEAWSFDTRVHPVDLEKEREVPGGGGTCFDIIEENIQQEMSKNRNQYPHIVAVFTDGAGNAVVPQKPKNWLWFMPNGSYDTYCNVSDGSVIHSLEEFEE